ncbi:MAG: IS1/IS1595 family N-terminal zinc-binding domain-containing protein [Rhabdochlamydiaceae bacterium]
MGRTFKMESLMEHKCPSCSSSLIKKNGHLPNRQQNHRCLACGRQFVLTSVLGSFSSLP